MRTFHPKWDHGGPSDYHELICKMSKRTNAARAGAEAAEEGGTFSHTCNVPQAPSFSSPPPVLRHFVYACARSQVAQKPGSFGLNLSSPSASASASVKTQSRPSSSSSSRPGPARLTMLLLELRADNSKTLAALLTL